MFGDIKKPADRKAKSSVMKALDKAKIAKVIETKRKAINKDLKKI